MAAAVFGFLKTPGDFACLRTGPGAVRGACRLERNKSDISECHLSQRILVDTFYSTLESWAFWSH